MKNIIAIVIFLAFFSCINIRWGYPQDNEPAAEAGTKTVDVNKDGEPDVTYYSDSDGKYVARTEADTNYDGKPDVVVHTKDGKFDSAEVDTDYDGKPDKKFTDTGEFNKWLNENKPDFSDKLNKEEWRFDMIDF